MKLLEGKTAIITGSARGIGKAIALEFAENGANIVITDLRIDDSVMTFVNELKARGINANAYAFDVSSFEACQTAVADILKEFPRIDVLVNNAGITRDNLLMRMSEQDWDMVLNINLKSVFNMTKAIQSIMLKQRFGSIVNMSSVVGIEGNAGQSNYSASKAGMIGFTKSIAQELGSRSIRCNAIAPGFIETDMTAALPEDIRKAWINDIPLKRPGQAKDVADVAVFLASDLSSYVTGQVISVCGGMQL